MKVHTTIGVYPNGNYKINGVKPEHLKEHIKYNKTMRFGRALLVDGVIEYIGNWENDKLEKYIILRKLRNIKLKMFTEPYR